MNATLKTLTYLNFKPRLHCYKMMTSLIDKTRIQTLEIKFNLKS